MGFGANDLFCALLEKLGRVDRTFFSVCAGVVVLCIAVYFLIPVFNAKQYQMQRDNLHKREAAFRSDVLTSASEQQPEEHKN